MKYKVGDWVRGDYITELDRVLVIGVISQVCPSFSYYLLIYYYVNWSHITLPFTSSTKWFQAELKPISEIEKALYL